MVADLTVIRALLASVQGFTPGPWRGDRNDGTIKYTVRGSDGRIVLTADHKNGRYGFVVGDNYDEGVDVGGEHDADESLFLAAPTLHAHLTELVDEVERLRGHNARMAAQINEIADACHAMIAEWPHARAAQAFALSGTLPCEPCETGRWADAEQALRSLAAGEVDDG